MSGAKSYRDLTVWQKTKELAILSYSITKNFPSDEKFALTSQARRAATSVPANIAEGFGRFANKDREHFYVIARGSLYELDTHMQIARDLLYISEEQHRNFIEAFEEVSRIISSFIKVHQKRASNL